ncbi:MAG: hypothetical protein CTY31_06655 [Hyphomicrobium sp.]|nr:MAG: hypothetical protein CTY39_06730 [Hyphomicrobium sp.]PPD00749.1 MAG: hypothetical protein CTY31_06655 [Hyphomicrobium sp.]
MTQRQPKRGQTKSGVRPGEVILPAFLSNLLYLLAEFARIPFDLLLGIKRRRYVASYNVAAPKDITWQVVSANKITLAGQPKIEIDTDADPSRPGVFAGAVRMGDKQFSFAYRVLEMRVGEAMSLEILQTESDPIYRYGSDYVMAVAVTGDDQSSRVTTTHDLTHDRFLTRLLIPLSQVQSATRLRNTAVEIARDGNPPPTTRVRDAIITGALTFASFFALFGPSIAAMLIGVILIHELGHVLAMRWAGIPVKGIYFVPFFGGVAIGSSTAKSEVERGLVALMGPGLSLISTALLLFLSQQSNDPVLTRLALLSALLNGFNLLPIFPLDGGHIMQSLLSRAGAESVRAFQVAALFAGGALSIWIGDYILLALFFIIAPSILVKPQASTRPLPPLSMIDTVWLAIGYGATVTFYILAISKLWGT